MMQTEQTAKPISEWLYFRPFEFIPIDQRRSIFSGQVILSFLLCYFLFFPLRGMIAPSVSNLYLGYIDQGSAGDSLDTGKDYIALIYFFLNQFLPYTLFTVTFVVINYFIISWRARNLQTALLHAIITFQILAFSFFITKESVLVLIGITTFSIHYLGYHRLANLWFTICIGLFAIFVRNYYAPLIAFGLLAHFFGWRTTIILGIAGAAFGLLIPEILDKLYTAKDQMIIMSRFRFHTSSIIPIHISERDVFGFLWDYMKSLLFIATPLLWSFGIKSMYAQAHFIMLGFLLATALRRGRRLYVGFALGVLGVMAYVVPDMGTWIRHSTAESVFLYLSLVTLPKPSPKMVAAANAPLITEAMPALLAV